jgi:hypothetical protein
MLWIVTLTEPVQEDAPAPGIPPKHYSDICYFQVDADTANDAVQFAMDLFGGAYTKASAELDDLNSDTA